MHRNVRAHARFAEVIDLSHVQIDRLHRAEGTLDMREPLIGQDRLDVGELISRYVGAQHVKPVERSLGIDLRLLSAERQTRVGDVQLEVFGHPVTLDHAPHAQANLALAAQSIARARGSLRNRLRGQFRFGRREQLDALAGALLGKHRVAAHTTNRSPG